MYHVYCTIYYSVQDVVYCSIPTNRNTLTVRRSDTWGFGKWNHYSNQAREFALLHCSQESRHVEHKRRAGRIQNLVPLPCTSRKWKEHIAFWDVHNYRMLEMLTHTITHIPGSLILLWKVHSCYTPKETSDSWSSLLDTLLHLDTIWSVLLHCIPLPHWFTAPLIWPHWPCNCLPGRPSDRCQEVMPSLRWRWAVWTVATGVAVDVGYL